MLHIAVHKILVAPQSTEFHTDPAAKGTEGAIEMQTQDFTKFAGVEQFEAAVKAGRDTFETALKTGKDAAEKAYKASADTMVKNVDKAYAATKDQVAKAWPEAAPKIEEAAELGKKNLHAAMAAGEIAKKGFEAIAEEVATANQDTVDETLENTKALFAVKSYQEWVELQTKFSRGAFDKAVANTTKLSELAMKVANEVVEPIQAQTSKAASKAAK